MNKLVEKDGSVMGVGSLPIDEGELRVKKTMKPLNNTIHEILCGDDDNLDSYEFNDRFVQSIKDRQKQELYEINDLDDLFK